MFSACSTKCDKVFHLHRENAYEQYRGFNMKHTIMGFSQDFPFDRKKSLGNSENSVNDKIIKLFSRKNRISLLIPRK